MLLACGALHPRSLSLARVEGTASEQHGKHTRAICEGCFASVALRAWLPDPRIELDGTLLLESRHRIPRSLDLAGVCDKSNRGLLVRVGRDLVCENVHYAKFTRPLIATSP